jgi:hypothetical protein
MSQLHGPILDTRPTARVPLPTVNELGRGDRVELAIEQLEALMTKQLVEALKPPKDQSPITAGEVRTAWKEAAPPFTRFRQTLESLHVRVLTRLSVADRRLGSAYSLGRSLSDTCWLPKDKGDFDRFFNKYRLARVKGWLTNLGPSAIPALSTEAVSQGLDHWAAWVAVNGSSDWTTQLETVRYAARAQGDQWRALLAGDKDPRQYLTPESYVQAGEAALRRAGRIVWRVVAHFWVPLLAVLLAMGGALYLAISFASGSAKFWSSLVSLVAGLGVTGKSVQASARQLASDAGRPLLDLAEADAIGWNATVLPAVSPGWKQQRQLRQLGVAPPSGGQPTPQPRGLVLLDSMMAADDAPEASGADHQSGRSEL